MALRFRGLGFSDALGVKEYCEVCNRVAHKSGV